MTDDERRGGRSRGGGGGSEPRRRRPDRKGAAKGERPGAGAASGRPRAAAFFCENCGMPVRLKDSVCPHCGRWFSAARCPQCGFVGEPKLFGDGCPACGYLKGEEAAPSTASPNHRRGAKARTGLPQEPGGAAAARGGGPPGWVYTIAALFLLALLLVFLAIILRSS